MGHGRTVPDSSGRIRTLLVLAALLAALLPVPCRAESWLLPVGSASIPIPDGFVVCGDPGSLAPFAREPDGSRIRVPSDDDAIGRVARLVLARTPSTCDDPVREVSLVAVGPWPTVDPSSVTLELDAGRGSLRGRNLAGAVVTVGRGERQSVDRCDDALGAAMAATCSFAFEAGASGDDLSSSIFVLPRGSNTDPELVGFDRDGRRLALDASLARAARIVLDRIVAPASTLDAIGDAYRIALAHPESIAFAECEDAVCDVDGGFLSVRDEHGRGDSIEVHLHLRPHYVLRVGATTDANPVVRLPVARCPITLVSGAPFRGVDDARIVLRVEGSCARDDSLAVEVAGEHRPIASRTRVDGKLFLLVSLGRIDSSAIDLELRRDVGIGARLRSITRRVPTVRGRLEIEGLGPIDFLPTNRAARIFVPTLDEARALVPSAVEGVYSVESDAGGRTLVRGIDGATGSVAMRFEIRDSTLPEPLRSESLGEVSEAVERAIRPANVPVSLATESGTPFVELLCAAPEGSRSVSPGEEVSLPFGARDTCRLVFHRERLDPSDGTQLVAVEVEVSRADGSRRSDSTVDTVVVLRPDAEPRTVYLGGIEEPFDRARVRVGIADADDHWAVALPDDVAAPELQWSLVMGTDRWRIYGTTSFPTALFRVSSNSGIMTLNAGALFRFVHLARSGRESIVGLESGAMWVSIAGTTASGARNSPLGEVAVVAGIGLGVPIANASRSTQTSISLHAWLEYEVSRAVRPGGGAPLGFVFGPSITVGDLGTDF